MFYVMSVTETVVTHVRTPKTYQAAEVVSSHKADHAATDAAHRLNRQAETREAFVVVENENKLDKGERYPQVLETALEQRQEAEAVALLVAIWEPGLYNPERAAQAEAQADRVERHAGRLAALGLSFDELVERYGAQARAEIERVEAERQERAEAAARREAAVSEITEAAQEHTYSFPAVRGIQAGKEYYIAQIPYGVLVKLFVFDEEDVPPELRAQRSLNEKRARDIGQYIVDNDADYVLPALTATVSKEMRFDAVAVSGASDRLGMLNIPITATLLINDGQHRRRGIEHAIAERPALRHETVAVTIFFDEGLERSQQIFSDINAKQVKPSSAINALYNQRDPFNAWLKALLDKMPTIKVRIDFENASVSAASHKLWSLVAFKKAVSLLTGVRDKAMPEGDELARCERVVMRFFEEAAEHVPQWRAMVEGSIPAKMVRREYVIGHTVWLDALATYANRTILGGEHAAFFDADGHDWAAMVPLRAVDPMKSAPMWQGRCVSLGRMQRTADGVKLTAAALMELAGKPLAADLADAEQRLQAQAEA